MSVSSPEIVQQLQNLTTQLSELLSTLKVEQPESGLPDKTSQQRANIVERQARGGHGASFRE